MRRRVLMLMPIPLDRLDRNSSCVPAASLSRDSAHTGATSSNHSRPCAVRSGVPHGSVPLKTPPIRTSCFPQS